MQLHYEHTGKRGSRGGGCASSQVDVVDVLEVADDGDVGVSPPPLFAPPAGLQCCGAVKALSVVLKVLIAFKA